MEVWKSPACGCCSGWATHLERNGLVVRIQETEDLGAIRQAATLIGALSAMCPAEARKPFEVLVSDPEPAIAGAARRALGRCHWK